MQLLAIILACSAMFSLAFALATPSPEVTVFHPNGKANKNAKIVLGYTARNFETNGVISDLTVTASFPDGRNERVFNLLEDTKGTCLFKSTAIGSFPFSVNDTGSYTTFWNFTFGTSPDPSSCTPKPSSFANILMNATFEVADLGTAANTQEMHTSSPRDPSGKADSGALKVTGRGLSLLSSAIVGWVLVAL